MQLFYCTWTHRGSLAPKSCGPQLFGAKEPVCNFLRYLDLFHAAVSQSVSQSPLVSRCSAGGEDRAALVATQRWLYRLSADACSTARWM